MSSASRKKPVRTLGSKSLKDYLATSKKPSRLLGPIERHILTRPLDTSRRQDIMHPSEITSDEWCTKAEYHKLQHVLSGGAHEYERHPLRMQSIFDVGHAAHAKWQRYLTEMGALYGNWSCQRCNRKWGDTTDSICTRCGELATYDELTLFDEDLMIRGHTDGWVTLEDPGFVLEIKTIGTGTIRYGEPSLLYDNDNNLEKAFEAIRRPFSNHRKQAQMYMYLLHDMYDKGVIDRKPPEEAVFLYECKANQAYKEFTIKYRKEAVLDILANAAKVVEALESGEAPECQHGGCEKCKGLK